MDFEGIKLPEGIADQIQIDPETNEVTLPPEMEAAISAAFDRDPDVARRRTQVEIKSMARHMGADAVKGLFEGIASIADTTDEPIRPRYDWRLGANEASEV